MVTGISAARIALSHAAQQQALDTGAPDATHDDQVGPCFGRGFDNDFGRLSFEEPWFEWDFAVDVSRGQGVEAESGMAADIGFERALGRCFPTA